MTHTLMLTEAPLGRSWCRSPPSSASESRGSPCLLAFRAAYLCHALGRPHPAMNKTPGARALTCMLIIRQTVCRRYVQYRRQILWSSAESEAAAAGYEIFKILRNENKWRSKPGESPRHSLRLRSLIVAAWLHSSLWLCEPSSESQTVFTEKRRF